MPTVTYRGVFYESRRTDAKGVWIRGKAVAVSQEWLNTHRHSLDSKNFLIEGDEGETVDLKDDGIPDVAWARKDILKWLKDNGVKTSGSYITKTAALDLVQSHLNPTVVEEVLNEKEDTKVTGSEE
ncbi:MAG: hypothetical protein CMC14_11465 [Flavobacteriaceae bacterium]|nr:hypothetical protein [Flavobacteriaceae bacterium]